MNSTTSSSRQPERIIRAGELAEGLGISRPTLWRMRRDGRIPQPLKIAPGVIGWRESTIERWLDEREAEAVAESEAATA